MISPDGRQIAKRESPCLFLHPERSLEFLVMRGIDPEHRDHRLHNKLCEMRTGKARHLDNTTTNRRAQKHTTTRSHKNENTQINDAS
eukprot:scaffold2679_cov140-Amphora_coffeaeformis.AAC.9